MIVRDVAWRELWSSPTYVQRSKNLPAHRLHCFIAHVFAVQASESLVALLVSITSVVPSGCVGEEKKEAPAKDREA